LDNHVPAKEIDKNLKKANIRTTW